MANLSVNGKAIGGNVFRLNDASQLDNLKASIKNDGRDQVIVKAENQVYVIEGDKLNFNPFSSGQAGKPAELKMQLDGRSVKAELIKLDDEVSSTMDGFKKAAVGVQVGFAGLMISEIVSKAVSGKVLVPATPRNSAIMLGIMGVALAGGVIYGATREPKGESQVSSLASRVN